MTSLTQRDNFEHISQNPEQSGVPEDGRPRSRFLLTMGHGAGGIIARARGRIDD